MKLITSIFCLTALLLSLGCTSTESYIACVKSDGIFVGKNKMQILAGEMHYFRILPECWRDRIQKLKACGLNTVSTYCAWNLHEPEKNQFNFSGRNDLAAFLKICQEEDVKVLLRPGPYICSEWDFGGLPYWLLKDKNIKIRTSDPKYFNHAQSYLKRILKEAEPFFCNNGGPIIAVQIENEYASYSNDELYVKKIKNTIEESGFKGILYTADGNPRFFVPVKIDNVWRTLTIGENIDKGIVSMEENQPDMPQMIAEWWVGQGIRLGVPLRVRDVEKMKKELDAVLSKGTSISCYMFHGGKSYGFMSGGLRSKDYKLIPFMSSYDVDALLNEAGDPTPKYFAFREIFLKYNPDAKKYSVPPASEKRIFKDATFDSIASFRKNIKNLSKKTVSSQHLLSMEDIGQAYGFINYKTKIKRRLVGKNRITLENLRDRAWIRYNGKDIGVIMQNDKVQHVDIKDAKDEAELEILVENMGRVNYGATLPDNRKGLGDLIFESQRHCGWEIDSIPLDSIDKIEWNKLRDYTSDYPAFIKGSFNVDKVADTYIDLKNFTRGYIWINGILLGRYDEIGPFLTTYIPAGILKQGKNEIKLLELVSMKKPNASFTDTPVGIVKDKVQTLPINK